MSETVYCHTTINHMGAAGAVPLEVDIYDARKSARPQSWTDNGFELQSLPSTVTDWSDVEAIEAVHYDEITHWAKATTGCDAVLFFPALLRNPSTQRESDDYAPIQLAHSDYTEAYEAMINDHAHPYQKVLSPSMQRAGVSAERLAGCRRVLTLQLWRSTGAADVDYPLCICDSTSVPRSQLAPVRVAEYGGVETQFDAFALLEPSPGIHNLWYTFPAMQRDEVVVFRAFDSERIAAGLPFWTPHCAFDDSQHGSSPRHSLEMRAICVFW